MQNKKVKINFRRVKNVCAALDDYSNQFGTSHENRAIEKQYFKQFLEKFPNQKPDLIDLYTDILNDHEQYLTDEDKNDQYEIQFSTDMLDLIAYFKTL